jgi:hypothetical protein
MGRAGAVVGVALFYAIQRNEGDAKIAVHIGPDDRLVVARNRPRELIITFHPDHSVGANHCNH